MLILFVANADTIVILLFFSLLGFFVSLCLCQKLKTKFKKRKLYCDKIDKY